MKNRLPEASGGRFFYPKSNCFSDKKCTSTARRIRAPEAHEFYTCEVSGNFPVSKAAG